MQFLSVAVNPKHVNFVTFFVHLLAIIKI